MANAAPKATRLTILSQLNESAESLHAQRIDADTLVSIYNDYQARVPELKEIAEQILRTLQKTDDIHAFTFRLKDPLHLIQKIIRKKKEYPERCLHTGNYLDYINDLIGVRVLYLYKSEWQAIGNYIQQVWPLKRKPYAYISRQDAEEHKQLFKNCNCKVLEHPTGYRAIHFVIATQPNKQRYYAEIQLRTLFEETWNEIDRHFRYPDHEHSALLDDLLLLLNKLTSTADETATCIRAFAQELNKALPEYQTMQGIAAKLKAHVVKLPVPEAEKQQLYTRIEKLL